MYIGQILAIVDLVRVQAVVDITDPSGLLRSKQDQSHVLAFDIRIAFRLFAQLDHVANAIQFEALRVRQRIVHSDRPEFAPAGVDCQGDFGCRGQHLLYDLTFVDDVRIADQQIIGAVKEFARHHEASDHVRRGILGVVIGAKPARLDLVSAVSGHDTDIFDPRRSKCREFVFEERLSSQFDKAFRPVERMWAKPVAFAGSENNALQSLAPVIAKLMRSGQ